MSKITLSDGLALFGVIAAIVLLVLDKAGKMRGVMLLVALGVAAIMTLPLALNNSWVLDASSGMEKFSRGMLMFFLVGFIYSGIAVWISRDDEKTDKQGNADEKSSTMSDAVRLAERANLRIDKWSVALAAGKRPDIGFELINSGRSQAEVTELMIGYKIASEDHPPTFGPGDSQVPLPAIVGPNSAIDVAVPIPEALTEDQFKKIMGRQHFIFLVGETSYRDIFNWTCTIRFGAQIGIHKDGKLGVTFIGRPGYNFVKWSAPQESAGKAKLEEKNKHQAIIDRYTALSEKAQSIERQCLERDMGCIERFHSWDEELSTYMTSIGAHDDFVQANNQSTWTMTIHKHPELHPEIEKAVIWLQAKQWFINKWIGEHKTKRDSL